MKGIDNTPHGFEDPGIKTSVGSPCNPKKETIKYVKIWSEKYERFMLVDPNHYKES